MIAHGLRFLALLLLAGCAARPRTVDPPPTRLQLATVEELTLCERMTRRVGVSAAWTGSTRPDVPGLPEITWLSADPEVVRIEGIGGITGVRPGSTNVIVHGQLGEEFGRTTFPVTVLPGEWDQAGSLESGETVCRRHP